MASSASFRSQNIARVPISAMCRTLEYELLKCSTCVLIVGLSLVGVLSGMRQLEVENKLRDVVSRIIVQVDLATSQGRTDINLALEDAFIPILKSVFNLPNLINLNRKQKNFPGIDLGDDHDRVCFQVTSTTSLDKVKSTIQQFMDRAYYNSFDELFIIMLSKKPKFSWGNSE
jgi:hypothetical protein